MTWTPQPKGIYFQFWGTRNLGRPKQYHIAGLHLRHPESAGCSSRNPRRKSSFCTASMSGRVGCSKWDASGNVCSKSLHLWCSSFKSGGSTLIPFKLAKRVVWKCFTSLDSQVFNLQLHGTKRTKVAELQPSSATPWSCSCGRLGSARPTIVMPSSGNITTKYSKSIGSHLPPGHPQLMPIPSRPTLKTLTTSEIDLASLVPKKNTPSWSEWKPMASWNVHLKQLLQNGRPHWHLYRKDLVEIPWLFQIRTVLPLRNRRTASIYCVKSRKCQKFKNAPSEAIAHWLAKTHLLPEEFFLVRLHPTLMKLKVMHLNQDCVTIAGRREGEEREREEGNNKSACFAGICEYHISGHQVFLCPCHWKYMYMIEYNIWW